MAIVINGSGTVTGISVGGLPDDIVDAGTLADNAVGLAQMAGGTDGNIITYDTSGNPAVVATGSDGQVLTSAGADAVPVFEAAAGGGKILQAVTATDETSRNTTSTSFVTASNTLTVDITPAATTSKIWIVVSAIGGHATSSDSVGFFTVYRDSTDLGAASDKGLGENYAGSSDLRTFIGFSVLDSPSTTSQITYQVYFRSDGKTGQIDLNWNGTKGTITVFELGA